MPASRIPIVFLLLASLAGAQNYENSRAIESVGGEPAALLARAQAPIPGLAEVPVQTWNYKSEGAAVRHIGPMAQDFYAAFHFGRDERLIGTIDADGVALAAIQELHRIMRRQDMRFALCAIATKPWCYA